jgi:hypothetical protein
MADEQLRVGDVEIAHYLKRHEEVLVPDIYVCTAFEKRFRNVEFSKSRCFK